ncbi:zinc-alpha-2-glycoprotein-like [Clupea harengus]|uniref:Zinc-alpha-2-glycoprotein-like n=1 Tax=Clupea harengus TaxID=7950 RepID=A0A8M1KV97_CLUHA|nr:zinc-alpha-2-glycoprotein-like [Clupea harengus]
MFIFETPVWIYLCLVIFPNLPNGSDVNTLEVQFTVFRAPNNKLQFQQTSLFNGHVIFTCNSQTLADQPRQDWVTHTFTQEELQERHKECEGRRDEHFALFEMMKTITVSVEVLQRRRGCIISSSGVFAFDEWAVNGEDFLTFGHQTREWTPLSVLATPVAVEWNKQDIRNHVFWNYLHQVCPNAHDTLKLKRATWINESAQTGNF